VRHRFTLPFGRSAFSGPNVSGTLPVFVITSSLSAVRPARPLICEFVNGSAEFFDFHFLSIAILIFTVLAAFGKPLC
jgi:hypothetical protein